MEAALPNTCTQPAGIEYRWYKWIFNNLVSGVCAEALISSIKANPAIDHESLCHAVREAQQHPYVLAGRDQHRKLSNREWLMKALDRVARLDESYLKIDRRPIVSFEEFQNSYYAKNRPIVFTDAIDHWPAKNWTPAQLNQRVGDAIVEVQTNRASNRFFERESTRHKEKMRFSDLYEKVRSLRKSNDIYMTANNTDASRHGVGELFTDIDQIGDGYLTMSDMHRQAFLWFGPAGTYTTLHHDLTNNFLVQIYGRKKIVLIPALQVPYLYNEASVYSEVNELAEALPDHQARFSQATKIEIILNPGEVAFIPIGWWHSVESLDVAISLSFVNFDLPNRFIR